jgi:ABC-2 type transport system permease protein
MTFTTASARRTVRMALFEGALMFRQRTTLLSNVIGPAVVLAFPLLSRPETRTQWTAIGAPSVVFVVLFTVYVTTAGAIAARRDMQILKRLRTSQLQPAEMLIALVVPLVLVGVLQIVVVLIGYRVLGAPAPAEPLLVCGAVVSSALLAAVSGIATGMAARDTERVQFAVLPLILVGAIAANLVLAPVDEALRGWIPYAPFAAIADLTARGIGVDGDALAPDLRGFGGVPRDVLISITWMALMACVARRKWQWEPRR